jgi:hypothetical protein
MGSYQKYHVRTATRWEDRDTARGHEDFSLGDRAFIGFEKECANQL